jgi:FAD/FMN-containing dehydrogenases
MNLAKIVLSHGGSVSAEHGIGIEKKTLLIEELRERNSEFNLKLMRSIKDNFDPQGLLNRGKIFD